MKGELYLEVSSTAGMFRFRSWRRSFLAFVSLSSLANTCTEPAPLYYTPFHVSKNDKGEMRFLHERIPWLALALAGK